MPSTRLRMRPWLEQQINSNSIPGLEWINKEQKIFQIPWKHAARHGWDMEMDACLFRSWAIHTGRYKPGEKQPDPKTWKANFRCAMNSLPDIEELKTKSINKGSDAVRVYRMLPSLLRPERRERKSKSLKGSKSRNRTKSTEDSLGTEDLEVRHNSCVPDDHSSYTRQTSSIQNLEIGSTDTSSDITECRMSTEALQATQWQESSEIMSADSTNDLYSFQVSPMPSSSDGTEEEHDQILADSLDMFLDQPSDWHQMSIDGKGFFINDGGFYDANAPDHTTDTEKTAGGEIELRVSADMKTNMDLMSWLDTTIAPMWPPNLTAIPCAL